MPTGYTAKLMEEGQTFPEFAMQCARAFGALIDMREEDKDAPIPETLPPSSYHANALAEAKTELALLDAMSEADRIEFGNQRKSALIESAEKSLARESQENARLDGMIESVKQWIPPSGEHEEMKKFMLAQLAVSKRSPYWQEALDYARSAEPFDLWLSARNKAAKDVVYHAKEHREELDRNAVRNNWLKLLRESLKNS